MGAMIPLCRRIINSSRGQPLTQGEEEFHIYPLAFKATEAEWNCIRRAPEPLARLEIKDSPGV